MRTVFCEATDVRLAPARGLGSLLCAAAVLTGGFTSAAPRPTGREIALEVDRRAKTATQTYTGKLEVRDGEKVQKKAWKNWRKGWGTDARSLLVFTTPAEVKGVTLLTLGKRQAADLQWMYTPAIDKTRRIAPQEKKTRFLGTHFSYEDMEFRDVDDRTYELEGEEVRDGIDCWVLLETPKAEKQSQYETMRMWIRKDLMAVSEAQYFVGGKVRRTLKLQQYRVIANVPTPMRWEMADTAKPGITVMELEDVRFDEPLSDDLFVPGFRPDLK